MTTAEIKEKILNDVVFFGLRLTIGVIFIVHGYSKFGNEGFVGWISSIGIPGELAIIIALAEVIPGILLIIGVLSRISASIISIIMIGAIFHVKGAESLTGDKGVEFDLILLAVALVIIVAGPGKISISQGIKKIPRCLH
ncbi:MAG: DoxX family protein [Nitrosopumilaceae archaeon]|nr:DoxX family protein [Nitrosopumilaceae archaeon]MBA4438895.1 DoxX family protein [Nitrosopumilaceae archaeon]